MNRELIGSPLMRLLRPFRKLTTTSIGFDNRHRHSSEAPYRQPSQRFRFFRPARVFRLSRARRLLPDRATQDFHVPLTRVSWKELPAYGNGVCTSVCNTPSQFVWKALQNRHGRRWNRKRAGQSHHGMRQLVFPWSRDSIIFATGASFMMGGACFATTVGGRQSRLLLLQTIAVARLSFVTTGSTRCPM
jgi:hypothetical protein